MVDAPCRWCHRLFEKVDYDSIEPILQQRIPPERLLHVIVLDQDNNSEQVEVRLAILVSS